MHISVIKFIITFVNLINQNPEFISVDYLEQKLDHFNSSSTATWNQRYFNNFLHDKSKGIQFLMINGESTASFLSIERDQPFVEWAIEVGANIWLLEHRFYGKSQPFENPTPENFEYLNSQQALEDIANFIRTKNREMKRRNNKWIVFGGSYSGSLALWFRQKYPDLVIGAVGSSAAISINLGNDNYLKVGEEAYRAYDFDCPDKILNGFLHMHELSLSEYGRWKINEAFRSKLDGNSDLAYIDIRNTYFLPLRRILTHAAQYNHPNEKNETDIGKICEIMKIESENNMMNLAIIEDLLGENHKNSAHPHQNFYIKQSNENEKNAKDLAWHWQVCNELLCFVTSNFNMFGPGFSLNDYISNCQKSFGKKFTLEYLKETETRMNKLYGGFDNYNGTNVVATGGSMDPWKDLVLTKSNHPSVITYTIEGGSHCEDFRRPTKNDSESLKKSTEIILQNIKKWIN